MKKIALLALIIGFISLTKLNAQTQADIPLRRNSIELNLIWPFIPKIYQVKYGREIFNSKNGMKGEFISSINYRPWTFADNEGDKTFFAVAIGYRHYWIKGFNSELAIYPEFVRIRNNVVDGNSYSDFYIVPEFYSGYKGFLGKKGYFYNVQLGVGKIIFPNKSYPRAEEPGIFFIGNLTIGYSF